uniref:Uncharacterized protein n=1 Tax=Megaselia scalaris TaxID=36166 RepID=T1GBM0_MEGSC
MPRTNQLIRLKKTVGILDKDGNEIIKQAVDEEMVVVKTPKEKKEQKIKEQAEARVVYRNEEIPSAEPEENVTIVNEKTGKSHTFNTKTLKDEFGTRPIWFKNRKLGKGKKKHIQNRRGARNYKQKWCSTNLPL